MAYYPAEERSFPELSPFGLANCVETFRAETLWHKAGEGISCWRQRMALRRQLRRLLKTPHMIADIGLSQEAVEREAAKGFWQA
jgi:uncharacterized protein YjiS (DUF1127 family)